MEPAHIVQHPFHRKRRRVRLFTSPLQEEWRAIHAGHGKAAARELQGMASRTAAQIQYRASFDTGQRQDLGHLGSGRRHAVRGKYIRVQLAPERLVLKPLHTFQDRWGMPEWALIRSCY